MANGPANITALDRGTKLYFEANYYTFQNYLGDSANNTVNNLDKSARTPTENTAWVVECNVHLSHRDLKNR